jgi:hypothetical protein
MLGYRGITMNVNCKKDQILERLRANLESHSKLVKEAREGYVKKASEELEKRLAQVKEGKISGLTFSLTAPKDYSSVYRTTIGMLEAHTGEDITLSATEYRQLIEDDWDWIHDFLVSNSLYSTGTRQYGAEKGFDIEG